MSSKSALSSHLRIALVRLLQCLVAMGIFVTAISTVLAQRPQPMVGKPADTDVAPPGIPGTATTDADLAAPSRVWGVENLGSESPGFATADQGRSQPQIGAAGDLIGFSHADGSGTQTITLVHTGKSWMTVYHIDKSGTIRLVSSRPIEPDFSLQFNATEPLPDEIRRMNRR